MRAYSFQSQVLARGQHLTQMRQRFLRGSKTVHTRIELKMHGQTMRRKIAVPLSRSAFERLNVPGFPDCGSEILGDDPILLTLPDSGHQQDAGLGAGAAQRQALRGIGNAQPLSAFGFKRARALYRTVAVTLRFDHATNGDAVADMLLSRTKIFSSRCLTTF